MSDVKSTMKPCESCGEETVDWVKVCPKCGTELKMRTGSKISLLLCIACRFMVYRLGSILYWCFYSKFVIYRCAFNCCSNAHFLV